MASTNNLPGLFTNQSSPEPIPSSSEPSVGDRPPPSTPPLHTSEPGTPYSTGYRPSSPIDIEYSPPMAAALLPGAPMTIYLMILTEYLTTQFKEAGNSGSLPLQTQMASMQELLVHKNYGREDMIAGFLHAVGIVVKAKKAFDAAMKEVTTSGQGAALEGLVVGEEAEAFRTGFSAEILTWEDTGEDTARGLPSIHLQRGILQAYTAVAQIKIAMEDAYERHADAKAKAEEDTEMETAVCEGADEAMDVDSWVKVEAGREDGKAEGQVGVDSAVGV